MGSPSFALAKGPTEIVPLAPGRLIGGKYALIKLLGGGSMGEVWEAEHRTLKERVAVKLLARTPRGWDSTEPIEDASSAAARFRFEARIAARLARSTKHVVRVTDHGEEGSLAYLVMELLDGTTLETMLIRHGPIAPEKLVPLVKQIASALEVAHADGVVHRDLKPGNIFVARGDDGAPLVKLLDFGIARSDRPASDSEYSTAANVVLGTPGYMSPEQVSGGAPPDRHYDLWALATVTYEALTTDLPVPGVHAEELIANLQARRFIPIAERAPDLPRALAAFFDRAFAPGVEERFDNAREYAQAFERAVRVGMGTAPMPQRPSARPNAATTARRVRRSKAPIGFAVASAIGALAVIAAFAWSKAGGRAESEPPPGAVTEPAPTPHDSPPVAAVPTPVNATASPGANSNASAGATPAANANQGANASGGLAPSPLPSRDVGSGKAAGATKPKDDCSVPYEFDAQGIKHWKRGCL